MQVTLSAIAGQIQDIREGKQVHRSHMGIDGGCHYILGKRDAVDIELYDHAQDLLRELEEYERSKR